MTCPTSSSDYTLCLPFGIWFGMWGVTMILQTTIFVLLGLWTKQALKSHSIQSYGPGLRHSHATNGRSSTNTSVTQRTFRSQSLTLASPPRTPTSRRPSTTGRSSATRVAPSSGSKTRLVKGSARSSLDVPPFPAGRPCLSTAPSMTGTLHLFTKRCELPCTRLHRPERA